MTIEKRQCESCGVLILPNTYDRTGGYCMPCSNDRQPVKPPSPEFVELITKTIEESRRLFRKWFPVLQDYALNCRESKPLPKWDSLSRIERSEYEVLRQKMLRFAEGADWQILTRPDTATIVTSTVLGILSAEDVFRERLESAVFLVEKEKAEWSENIYQHSTNSPWWFVDCWWTIRLHLTDDELGMIDKRTEIMNTANLRVISSGLVWGPFQGGYNSELWNIEDDRFRFMQGLCLVQF
jgi:hypothetical protein